MERKGIARKLSLKIKLQAFFKKINSIASLDCSLHHIGKGNVNTCMKLLVVVHVCGTYFLNTYTFIFLTCTCTLLARLYPIHKKELGKLSFSLPYAIYTTNDIHVYIPHANVV